MLRLNVVVFMSFAVKHALVTGSSRGIVFKLAEWGARVAVHYYRNVEAAQATPRKIRNRTVRAGGRTARAPVNLGRPLAEDSRTPHDVWQAQRVL